MVHPFCNTMNVDFTISSIVCGVAFGWMVISWLIRPLFCNDCLNGPCCRTNCGASLASTSNTLNLSGCCLLPRLAVPNAANASYGRKGGAGFVVMEELVDLISFDGLAIGIIGFKGLTVGGL